MNIKERLMTDLKIAMRAKDSDTRNTIRSLQAAIKQREIDSGALLDEAAAMAVIAKQGKQRRESIELFVKGGREDLASAEKVELAVIERYLPKMMSREAVADIVKAAIASTGASSMRDMGRVMGAIMPQVKGKADGRVVSAVVKEQLSG